MAQRRNADEVKLGPSRPHQYAEHGPAQLSDVLRGVGLRLRWRRLAERHDARIPLGFLALVNGAISIGLMAVAARLTHQPLVFPSLGPTAFLLFYRPHAEVSCPRNALVGHLIGAVAGLGSLAAFGLLSQPPALTHISTNRIGAAALSLGATAAGMVWTNRSHPPAGATTLIVSLGFLHTVTAVGVLLGGVALLVCQGLVVNRWAGIDYPLWAPRANQRPAPTFDPLSGGKSNGGDQPMHVTVFVDAEGDPAAPDGAFDKLRVALGPVVHDFTCHPHEWTALFDVEAVDRDEAADVVRKLVDEAGCAAGLQTWHYTCWEVHETLLRLDDNAPQWHPKLPHIHLRLRHR